jgi:hypothetical protein
MLEKDEEEEEGSITGGWRTEVGGEEGTQFRIYGQI